MSEKHYMKMADAFVHDDVASLEQHIYAGHMSQCACEYAAHAISSHDELVDENGWLHEALKFATNHSPDAGKLVVPEGWQLVPVEPTEAMISYVIDAGSFDEDDVAYFWYSMLAAAPKLRD